MVNRALSTVDACSPEKKLKLAIACVPRVKKRATVTSELRVTLNEKSTVDHAFLPPFRSDEFPQYFRRCAPPFSRPLLPATLANTGPPSFFIREEWEGLDARLTIASGWTVSRRGFRFLRTVLARKYRETKIASSDTFSNV